MKKNSVKDKFEILTKQQDAVRRTKEHDPESEKVVQNVTAKEENVT